MRKRMFQLTNLIMMAIVSASLLSCGSDDDDSNTDTLIGEWISVPSSKVNTPVFTYSFKADDTGFFESSAGVWADFKYTTSGGYNSPMGSIYLKYVFVNSKYNSVWRSERSGSYRVFGDSLRLTDDGINTILYTRKKYR